MQHFPSSGPATNSGHGSSNAPGCHPPHTGTPGAGARGADQCHATANHSTLKRPLALLWWGVGTGSQTPQEMGSPRCPGPAAVREGLVG